MRIGKGYPLGLFLMLIVRDVLIVQKEQTIRAKGTSEGVPGTAGRGRRSVFGYKVKKLR